MATPRETKVFLAKFGVCLVIAIASVEGMIALPNSSAWYKGVLAAFFVSFICAIALFLRYASWLARYGRGEMRKRYLEENAPAAKPWER